MANGAVLLKWRDRNWAEHGHYVYRSDTPMDINNLPSPIDTLLPNEYEYIDYDVIADQTYYYRIGAFRNNDVSVSDEISVVATPSTVSIFDVFGDNSAIAVYPFDSDSQDLGVSNHGTWSGGELYGVGVFGNSAEFNGSSYIETTNPTLLPTSGSFSASLWFKTQRNSSGSTSLGGLVSRGRVRTSSRNYGLSLGIGNNGLSIWRGDGGTTELSHTAGGTLDIDRWYFAVFNYDGSTGTSELFLDGVSVGTKSIGNNPVVYISTYDSGVFRIGDYGSISGFEPLNGSIDQLRIFNRELTIPEIQILHREQY